MRDRLRFLDTGLLLPMVVLVLMGTLTVYSAGRGTSQSTLWLKQALWNLAQDPAPSVKENAAFAIKLRTPLDQLRNAQRPLGHQHLCRGRVNQAVPCVDGVFEVQRNIFFARHGDGDAALRVVGVRLAH